MVKTLSILLDKYDIPYIPTKGCNPEKLLEFAKTPKSNKSGYTVYEEALFCAAAGNNVDIAKHLLRTVSPRPSGTAIYEAFNSYAAREEAYDVLNLLKNEVKGKYWAYHDAIRYGKLNLLKFMIKTEFVVVTLISI